MKFPIVRVVWIDVLEHEENPGFDFKTAKELEVALEENTVGWLLNKGNGRVRIGNDYSPKDKSFRRVIVLPASIVVKITKLEEKK